MRHALAALVRAGRPADQGRQMTTGPKGQKRPADVIGNATKVARIATGEEDEEVGRTRAKQWLSGP